MLKNHILDFQTIHGNLIYYQNYGCLLVGDSGCGKSLFAKYIIDHGGILVADDIVKLSTDDHDHIYGSAAKGGEGYMEIFGLGIIKLAKYLPKSPIDCIFYSCPIAQTPRIYTSKTEALLNTDLFVFPLDYHHFSAFTRFKAYLQYLSDGRIEFMADAPY